MRRFLLVSIFLLAGCGERVIDDYTFEADEELVQQISDYLKEDESVEEGIVIANGDDWLITYQVKALHRFNKKAHETKIKEHMEALLPNAKVTVSNDFKLFYESKKLLDKSATQEKTKKQIKELKKLKEEQT